MVAGTFEEGSLALGADGTGPSMEAIMVTGALILAREARNALGPRVKAAAEHLFGLFRPIEDLLSEGESDTKALLSRGFEWAEDVFPAVALGCAALVANNQVPITILSVVLAWILGCRIQRRWQEADAPEDASQTQKPAKRTRFTRLCGFIFPPKQSPAIYTHSTVKLKTILDISANHNEQVSGTNIDEELARHRLHEKMQQKVDGGVKTLAPFLKTFLTERVGENAGGKLLHRTTFTDRRSSVLNDDATKGLSRKTRTTIANIQNEMWNGPELTLEEKKQGFSYVAWTIVPLKDRNEGRLVVLWHKIEDNDRHSGEVATFSLSAPFMARFVEPSKWCQQQYCTLWHWFIVITAAVALFGWLAYRHTALPLTPEPILEGNIGVDGRSRTLGEEETAGYSDFGQD